MRSKILILSSFAILLLFPSLALADCADLGNYTSWVSEDSHTVVFYMESKPIARLEISDCMINSSSSIRLIKSYLCDSDDIMIDGEKCSVMTLNVMY